MYYLLFGLAVIVCYQQGGPGYRRNRQKGKKEKHAIQKLQTEKSWSIAQEEVKGG
jgi:hypothetical protein